MIRAIYRTLRRTRDEFRYRGTGVECNCCGGAFRALMPYGHVTVRPNARCPRCFSAERQRMVLHYLRHRTDVFTAPMSVLHFAPEEGIERHLRQCARLKYITADLDASRADVAMDITDIPCPTGTFDLVLCSHVLEHVPDDRKAMREIHRVLKPGGFAILQVPLYTDMPETYENPEIMSPKDRLKHFDQPDHVRKYGMDYFDRLRDAGFEVNRADYGSEVGEETAQRLGFWPQEMIERCDKPTP